MFFYTKKIITVGKENIPKKGAVLFAVNHPNGLLDPLVVTTNVPRDTFYLVRAAAFKNALADKILRSLHLMPIYRIRDGRKEISKNEAVFKDCFEILKTQKTLMIFPEGSHDQRRTIRTISKGFTRIIFGALERYPDLEITIIPVGISYQNVGQFPSKVAIHYGAPIAANTLYNPTEISTSTNLLKEQVSNQLKKISVHISDDVNYASILEKLNKNNTDFTKVNTVNHSILNKRFVYYKKGLHFVKPIYYLLLLNSIIPYLIWKIVVKKIDEREFIDTFRVALVISLFPLFYVLQSLAISYFYTAKIAGYYLILTAILTLVYVKLSPTPTE